MLPRRTGKVSVTHLATGDYEVQDVKCQKCSTSLGWTYLKAFTEVCIQPTGALSIYERLQWLQALQMQGCCVSAACADIHFLIDQPSHPVVPGFGYQL